jgi:hypothetical protein
MVFMHKVMVEFGVQQNIHSSLEEDSGSVELSVLQVCFQSITIQFFKDLDHLVINLCGPFNLGHQTPTWSFNGNDFCGVQGMCLEGSGFQ